MSLNVFNELGIRDEKFSELLEEATEIAVRLNITANEMVELIATSDKYTTNEKFVFMYCIGQAELLRRFEGML